VWFRFWDKVERESENVKCKTVILGRGDFSYIYRKNLNFIIRISLRMFPDFIIQKVFSYFLQGV